MPISSRDRVYAADQTSNTVSVIDPSANKLLGVIRLGDPVPGALSALYKGQLLVHGLGYSPDSKTLAVVSIASNSVTLIDTATNKVNGVVYVGRSPHEAFLTPNGRELTAVSKPTLQERRATVLRFPLLPVQDDVSLSGNDYHSEQTFLRPTTTAKASEHPIRDSLAGFVNFAQNIRIKFGSFSWSHSHCQPVPWRRLTPIIIAWP